MVSASFFSLLFPAIKLGPWTHVISGLVCGLLFISFMTLSIRKLTQNVLHQRAFLFVFVMGLHNIPEGLAVGVDVAALGWKNSLPLTIAIFIQNLPEGLASAMSFLISGFNVRKSMAANGVTALIETTSAYLGYSFVSGTRLGLPFLLSFAGACMLSVVAREGLIKIKGESEAEFSFQGFGVGLLLCGLLDLLL